DIRTAPDVMVVFGRPKGDRGSYKQWEEDNIAPQVVFEVLSPGNTIREMNRKLFFYNHYGVEEYYIYNPDTNDLAGLQRQGCELRDIEEMNGWVSPRLGIRFELTEETLNLYDPQGEVFLTPVQVRERAEQERLRAEQERLRAEQEAQRAEQEKLRADRFAAKLRELGLDPDTIA
ncbi:MAG: Uma2 family endonuclease, partial [Pseudanabaenaceae cyanobacterium SKYGB_i_bin29]|nr:Uma2 family endonuclease [Pseudanabaenaceae cyanobacterium SKYG29]MDW8422686.1 Uma2 family endonuclease [Pseudanabaenaceae cyanobacterium SKYGB_i_bin29]